MSIEKSKEAMLKLVLHFKGDDLALQLINDTLNYFTTYIRLVNKQENLLTTMKGTMDPEELRAEISTLDKRRHTTHNAMIAGVKAVNRMCTKINCPLFYDGNEEDRYEIADFALVIAGDTFMNRTR